MKSPRRDPRSPKRQNASTRPGACAPCGLLRFKVDRAHTGTCLWDFLCLRLDISKRSAKRLLDQRLVFVNGQRTWMGRHPLKSGDEVAAPPQLHDATQANSRPQSPPLKILGRFDGVWIIDKPPGLLSNEAKGSAEMRLRRQADHPGLLAIHRLDRDTSGCMLFAETPEIKALMVDCFRKSLVDKSYLALVRGAIRSSKGEVNTPLDGKSARTLYTRLDNNGEASLLRLHIPTGRTHQIRRHLAAIGHPILGDKQYGVGREMEAQLQALPRHMLHASALAFTHPASGDRISIDAPLPADFRAAALQLKLNLKK